MQTLLRVTKETSEDSSWRQHRSCVMAEGCFTTWELAQPLLLAKSLSLGMERGVPERAQVSALVVSAHDA